MLLPKYGLVMFPVVLCVFLLFWCISVLAAESDSFKIPADVLSSGGCTAASTSFNATGTLGQSAPLMVSTSSPPGSDSCLNFPGFWYTVRQDQTCPMAPIYMLLMNN